MKIIKVTIHNINSIQGTHQIDFQKSFNDYGIFLITGDTGSGKSTILDSICVALYGSTPRLKGASEVKNLFAMKTDSCFSEVEFEVDNILYKSYWGLSRVSRGKNKGEIKDSKVQLSFYKDGNWELIDGNKRELIRKVEEITNLNMERFTKTVLLAQGSFDAFLKAPKSEKSEILEKITGTQIYQKISKRVYEKYKIKVDALNLLKERLQDSDILDETIIKEKENIIDRDKKQNIFLEKEIERIRDSLYILQNIKNYRVDIEHFTTKKSEIKKNIELFAPQKIKLQNALKSKDIYLSIMQKNSLEEDIKDISKKRESLQDEYIKLEEKKIFLQQELIEAKKAKEEFVQESILQRDKLQKAREYITQRDMKNRELGIVQQEFKNRVYPSELELEDNTKIDFYIDEIKDKIDVIEKKLVPIGDLYKQQKIVEKSLNNLLVVKNLDQEIFKNREKIVDYQKRLEKLDEQLSEYREKKEHSIQEIERLEKLQRELSKIKDYEQERLELGEDDECPLCGSKNHPYKSSLPAIDINLIDDIKQNREYLKDIEEKLEIEKNLYISFQSDIKMFQSIINNFLEKREQIVIFSDDTQESLEIQERELSSKIEEILIMEKDVEVLEKRYKDFENLKEKLGYEKRIEILNLELKNFDRNIKYLLDGENLHLIEERMKHKEKVLENNLQKLGENERKLDQDITTNVTNSINSKSNQQSLESKKREIQLKIDALIDDRGFKDELEVKEFYIEDEEFIKTLQTEQIKLYQDEIEIDTLLKDTDLKLSLELQKARDRSEDIPFLKIKKDDLEREREKLKENITLLKRDIEESLKLKDEQYELYKQIEDARKELIIFEKLNELIGKADGAKYQIFVQNLTLGDLLELANKHLKYLNDRYTLQKVDDENLTISIMDNYYFNEIRNINTLSGGESFLVSLALALGLSDLVNDRIRVDTLFLDEGFGTLDEETLHSAINALEKLQLQGKMIGIISHVTLLKERIFAQIRVHKNSSGKSNLEIIC